MTKFSEAWTRQRYLGKKTKKKKRSPEETKILRQKSREFQELWEKRKTSEKNILKILKKINELKINEKISIEPIATELAENIAGLPEVKRKKLVEELREREEFSYREMRSTGSEFEVKRQNIHFGIFKKTLAILEKKGLH